MKIILLEKISTLGDIGDVVTVKPGYARNYLLPKQFAQIATAENIKQVEEQKEQLRQNKQQQIEEATNLSNQLSNEKVVLEVVASDEGKLFGSVTAREVADHLNNHGYTLARKQVSIPEKVIRATGDYVATIKVHSEISVDVPISVVAK